MAWVYNDIYCEVLYCLWHQESFASRIIKLKSKKTANFGWNCIEPFTIWKSSCRIYLPKACVTHHWFRFSLIFFNLFYDLRKNMAQKLIQPLRTFMLSLNFSHITLEKWITSILLGSPSHTDRINTDISSKCLCSHNDFFSSTLSGFLSPLTNFENHSLITWMITWTFLS